MSNQEFEHHAATDWDPINLEVELLDCKTPALYKREYSKCNLEVCMYRCTAIKLITPPG